MTERTRVEAVTNDVIWDSLEMYTHVQHGTDENNTEPATEKEYPVEHSHYRKVDDRRAVVINKKQKVSHVTL